jgi:hypothetical protein
MKSIVNFSQRSPSSRRRSHSSSYLSFQTGQLIFRFLFSSKTICFFLFAVILVVYHIDLIIIGAIE